VDIDKSHHKGPDADALIHLSAMQEHDLPTLYEWFSDADEWNLWTNIRRPMSIEEFGRGITQQMQGSSIMIARDSASQTPLGFLQLYDMALRDGVASFLIYLSRDRRSLGYGILATVEFLAYAFKAYPIRKVYADAFEFNKHSVALLLTGGFREVGRLRKHIWWADRYWDQIKYVLLREDLEALHNRFLGYWGTPNRNMPEGFGRREAQRLMVALVTAIFRNGPQERQRLDPGTETHTEDCSHSRCKDIGDFSDMISASRESYAVEEGYPGFAEWTYDRWREYLVPVGHLLHTTRNDDGTLLAALACRDEIYKGEPATRIWSWASSPSLSSEERDRAEMSVVLECAAQAIERGRSKLFVYVQKNTSRADRASRVLGDSPEVLPFAGTMVITSDLPNFVKRARGRLGIETVQR